MTSGVTGTRTVTGPAWLSPSIPCLPLRPYSAAQLLFVAESLRRADSSSDRASCALRGSL